MTNDSALNLTNSKLFFVEEMIQYGSLEAKLYKTGYPYFVRFTVYVLSFDLILYSMIWIHNQSKTEQMHCTISFLSRCLGNCSADKKYFSLESKKQCRYSLMSYYLRRTVTFQSLLVSHCRSLEACNSSQNYSQFASQCKINCCSLQKSIVTPCM